MQIVLVFPLIIENEFVITTEQYICILMKRYTSKSSDIKKYFVLSVILAPPVIFVFFIPSNCRGYSLVQFLLTLAN